MIDIENRAHMPSVTELSAYVGNPLFDELCGYMDRTYGALQKIEYSGDKVLLGWNLKFKKGGRTLCTVYPRPGHFPMLLIVGPREKARVEALLPTLSPAFQDAYNGTREGMGQRWMLLDFDDRTALYEDMLKIVQMRREYA